MASIAVNRLNDSSLADEISDSIEPVKILLSDIFQRLHLKEINVKMTPSAAQSRMQELNDSSLADEISDSIEPVKILLSDIFQGLHLKEKNVKITPSAAQSRMQELNKSLDTVEEVNLAEKTPKSILKKLPKLAAFINHCCHSRHYSFCIKKCGEPTCEICGPVRLPSDLCVSFQTLSQVKMSIINHLTKFTDLKHPNLTDLLWSRRARSERVFPS